MMDMIKRVQGLQTGVARDVFPNGAVAICRSCGRRSFLTYEDCARCFRAGWPTCCGVSMETHKAREGETAETLARFNAEIRTRDRKRNLAAKGSHIGADDIEMRFKAFH